MTSFSEFAASLTYDAIPEEVRAILRRSFADTLGVAAVGSTTEISVDHQEDRRSAVAFVA